jgi:hypothetical protein
MSAVVGAVAGGLTGALTGAAVNMLMARKATAKGQKPTQIPVAKGKKSKVIKQLYKNK